MNEYYKKELINKKTAKLAKEIGFPQEGKELFNMHFTLWTPLVLYTDDIVRDFFYNTNKKNREAVIVTKFVLLEWIRNKYKFDLSIAPLRKNNQVYYNISIFHDGYLYKNSCINYNNRNSAINIGLFEILNIIKNAK